MSSSSKIKLPWDNCTGCYACLNVCPVEAISLPEDKYGFIHAVINQEKCIECHLCEKTCPEYKKVERYYPTRVFAAVSNDEIIQLEAASGGFLSELSRYIISQNGIVYGCAEINCTEFRHIRIENEDDIFKLRKSKYVQSEIGFLFKDVKKDLDNRRLVLFTGTACQIAGLYNFLKKKYNNLITSDILCHGVPPMKMLKEQIESYNLIKKQNIKEIHLDFRWKYLDKSNKPVIKYGMRFYRKNEDHEELILDEDQIHNAYMRCFHSGVSLRDSCLSCQYASKERISDITCADFWGIGSRISSKLNSKNGVSLILVNTDKGIYFFNTIQSHFIVEEHKFEDAVRFNQCLSKPTENNNLRSKFLETIEKKGLIKATKEIDHLYRFESKSLVKFLKNNKSTHLGYRSLKKFFKILRYIKKYK